MSLTRWLSATARIAGSVARTVPFSERLPLVGGGGPRSAHELERLASGHQGGLFGPRHPSDRRARAAIEERRTVLPLFVAPGEPVPPPDDAVFVSVCNDKYAPGLEATALSLKRQYPTMRNRYVVFHDAGLSPFVRARLQGVYEGFEFSEKDPAAFRVSLGEAYNHRRVGLLGYLSLHALELAEPPHVIVLDSDLLVLGDVSPLWHGHRVKAVPDVGRRPFGVVSRITGRPVLNSGVLSLPRSARGPAAWRRAMEVVAQLDRHEDRDTEGFADQRFWNAYLADVDVELLPQSYNAIKTLVELHYPHELGKVAILHMTGPKPWYGFSDRALLSREDRLRAAADRRSFARTFGLWEAHHHGDLLRRRLATYRWDCGPTLRRLAGTREGRPAVMIGNGPSIRSTDLTAFDGYEKVAFNWFVNHEDFDAVAPDHLVVVSHMLFGGWNTSRPHLPEAYLAALRSHRHKPRLWFSYYFRPYLESVPELADYERSYVFYEKPFKERIAHSGLPQLDLSQPLVDANTGVLTAGVPLAVHLGCRDIVLVGCDSNYGSTRGSYFYPAGKHGSATTASGTLVKTWQPGGEGQFGYTVTARALAARGVTLHDATLHGRLEGLPRLTIDAARALAASAPPSRRPPRG